MRKAVSALVERQGRERGQHPGLLLQRFLIKPRGGDEARRDEKQALLRAARRVAGNAGLVDLYRRAFDRWQRVVGDDPLTLGGERVTESRMVIGLGSESVLETGLRLHQTYGVPVIPGSALKGLASHYCDRVWGQAELGESAPDENKPYRRRGPYHDLLFGRTDDGGVITFHDAWIMPASLSDCLCPDVMTPHHLKWQTGDAPPTDFDSPNPVPFLAVRGTFLITVCWSGPAGTPPEIAETWIKRAFEILDEALGNWGIGGKTSSGYGRLVPPSERVGSPPPGPKSTTRPSAVLPKANDRVEGQLLEKKTKNGGWRARHEPSGLEGEIQNTNDVPADRKAGELHPLVVASVDEKNRKIAFKWLTPSIEEQVRKSRGPDQGRPGGQRRTGRR